MQMQTLNMEPSLGSINAGSSCLKWCSQSGMVQVRAAVIRCRINYHGKSQRPLPLIKQRTVSVLVWSAGSTLVRPTACLPPMCPSLFGRIAHAPSAVGGSNTHQPRGINVASVAVQLRLSRHSCAGFTCDPRCWDLEPAPHASLSLFDRIEIDGLHNHRWISPARFPVFPTYT